VKEDRFVVRIAEGTKIEITKGSVTTVVSSEGDA
jgi:preprotein translocase subunit YajC